MLLGEQKQLQSIFQNILNSYMIACVQIFFYDNIKFGAKRRMYRFDIKLCTIFFSFSLTSQLFNPFRGTYKIPTHFSEERRGEVKYLFVSYKQFSSLILFFFY